jgi:hypothetical protein
MNDSVDKEAKATEPPPARWAISLEWFEQNHRSATALISEHLCAKCADKLSPGKKDSSPEELISTIQRCCSNTPEFISHRLPIMESVFRLFLGNGNQAMGLDEVGQQLNQLRGGDAYRTSPEALLRLLKSDRYYGLHEMTP